MSAIGLRPAGCMTCNKRFYLRHSRVKDYNLNLPKPTYVRGPANECGRSPTDGQSGKAA